MRPAGGPPSETTVLPTRWHTTDVAILTNRPLRPRLPRRGALRPAPLPRPALARVRASAAAGQLRPDQDSGGAATSAAWPGATLLAPLGRLEFSGALVARFSSVCCPSSQSLHLARMGLGLLLSALIVRSPPTGYKIRLCMSALIDYETAMTALISSDIPC